MTGPSAGRSWKLAGQGCCPTRKGADAGQVSLCRNTDNDPEPKDKLDNMTTTTPAAPASASLSGVSGLNGPEDEPADWFAIDWQTIEQDVRRLRLRIFTCLLEPDAVKVARPVLRGPGAVMRPAYPTIKPPDTPETPT